MRLSSASRVVDCAFRYLSPYHHPSCNQYFMASNTTPLEAAHARSYAILEAARQKAQKGRNYNSPAYHKDVADTFLERHGSLPHLWQLDATEATHLGLDSIVIAGTGSGKTMPFVMPLLVDEKKKAIVILPLKILQQEHVRS